MFGFVERLRGGLSSPHSGSALSAAANDAAVRGPGEHSVHRIETEILNAQHERIGTIDTFGILAIAVLVPVSLWSYVNQTSLLVWSGLVALTTLGWFDRAGGREDVATTGVWLSGAAWALLPWLTWTSLDSNRVAWVVIFVLAYGLATDAVLLPQTFKVSAQPLMFFYALSYMAAFVSRAMFVELAAILIIAAPLAVGIYGYEHLKTSLMAERVRVEGLASTDPLTGLASRLGAVLELERRSELGLETHVVICDVDDFKWLNTHLGQHHGDVALKQVAGVLGDLLDGWFLARLGGDEFLGISDRELSLAERVSVTTIAIEETGDLRRRLSMSVGTSSAAAGDADPESLMSDASLALQQAKLSGRGRVVDATPHLLEAETERRVMADKVRSAIEDDEIVPWAQPIVDMETGTPIGAEMLARWPQPDGSMIMPNVFVPVVEAHGLSRFLGRIMLRQAIGLLERLGRPDEEHLFLSVNISASHIVDPNLVDYIDAQLAGRNVAAERLLVELTETEQVADPDMLLQALERLRAIGIGVATDDVGSGWSSLNQMIETPFSHVKIDRSLVTAMDRPGGVDLVASICSLARGTGQTPIAEGIEYQRQVELLLEAGFRIGQGFLFDRPMPIEDLVLKLRYGADAASRATDGEQLSRQTGGT